MLRRLARLKDGEVDCIPAAIVYCTVQRGDDGILRDFTTGEPLEDGPDVPGVPRGEFRFMTTLGEVD